MDYGPSDSSGTDDDLPPSHQTRVNRGGGRVAGNGRAVPVGSLPYSRVQNDMETEIHWIEQEAYGSVLRAFKAQADAITWEKEGLMSELRKELRVSDEEHRELLARVNADETIRRIREWRKSGGLQPGLLGAAQPGHDPSPSPTVSASRKKQKTSHQMPSLSLNAPSPNIPPQTVAASMHPSSSAAKRGAVVGARGKKPKSGQTVPGVSSMKPLQYSSTPLAGRGQVANRGSSGALVASEPAEAAAFDPLIGRKVMTRWPEDNNFYEAVITDYNPKEGRHALVYDINTKRETWEWVNLKEICPEDITWEGEDPGISRRGGRGGPGRGIKKSVGRGGAVSGLGRGRGGPKNQSKKDFPPTQNGIGKKASDDIEILHTDTLIKEVERVFSVNHPDPVEIDKAKKMLKEHEQSLIDAIARLANASDGESEEGEHPFSHGQSVDRERGGWRNQQYGGAQHFEDEGAGEGRGEGSDADPLAGDAGPASDDQQEGDDGDDII
ncbi:protein EMSY-LIKE 3 isoform X2 [Amborella trichopoda]|uniref:protein EMSY-LIKE 3 isoform X2 n=1 Tax=Amborella trichopoda TaxID=13333 RepID=UPI0005D35DBE|nr:protein EMSY-LIKE 3 isoform X2 [Amborella trichopoda]|eukprot:XP_011625434.1 protein EMSY-LIKE 3 isoform X2 [Amborella trichopoda]